MNLPTQIELRSIRALLPHARNSRTHSDAQVAQVAASIREFGWTNPILVDSEGMIIAGHARLLAARKLGMDEVPVIVLAHLTPVQKRALVIADNKLALNAGWDEETLRVEIESLQEDGFDLDVVGFSEEEIRVLLADNAGDPEADAESPGEDETPEAPVDPVSRTGDIWVIGRHRMICGDCRDSGTVPRLFDGARANVVITSPPYATQREYDPASGFKPVPPEEYCDWFRDVAANVAAVLAPDGSYFLNIKEHADDGEREPLREGSGDRAPAAVGLAVRRRVLLAQDRQRRAGRLGQSLQERLGAGVPFLQAAADQVPAQGGWPRVGGLLRLLAEQPEIDFRQRLLGTGPRGAADGGEDQSLAGPRRRDDWMAGTPASRGRAT